MREHLNPIELPVSFRPFTGPGPRPEMDFTLHARDRYHACIFCWLPLFEDPGCVPALRMGFIVMRERDTTAFNTILTPVLSQIAVSSCSASKRAFHRHVITV